MILTGTNIGIGGMKKEVTRNVNPIPDFTAVDAQCNPVFFNQDKSFDLTINDLDAGVSKALTGTNAMRAGDHNAGRFTYDLTFGGDIQDNGMGFLIEAATINSSFDTATMTYKIETSDKTCYTDSYSFYIPIGCAVNKTASNGMVLTGGKPVSFKLMTDKTYEMTMRFAVIDFAPTTIMLPVLEDGNYYDKALTLDFSNMKKTGTKIEKDGTEISSTTQADFEITYDWIDNQGFFDADGVEVDAKHNPIVCKITYAANYDSTPSASNNTATLLANHKNRDKITGLKLNIINDATHSIIIPFSAVVTEHKFNTPGSDVFSFNGVYNPCATSTDFTYDLSILHIDEYGDITDNL